jgi:hypothetical protein
MVDGILDGKTHYINIRWDIINIYNDMSINNKNNNDNNNNNKNNNDNNIPLI